MFLILAVALLSLLVAVPAASAQYPGGVLPPTAYPGFSLVAGTYPPAGDPGDGGPATQASLGGISAIHLSGDGELLLTQSSPGAIRIISAAGTITTLLDEDLETPYGIGGGRSAFVVGDVGSDTVSRFDGFGAPGETIMRTGIHARDITSAGAGLPGTTFASWWVVTEAEIGLLRENVGGGEWVFDGLGGWDPHGVGDRTAPGGGVLWAQYGGFGLNQDCRIYAMVPPGGAVPVAGVGPCTGGGGVVGNGKPASQAYLNYPNDVEGTPDGGFVITEQERLSRVAPDGTYSVLFTATGPDDLDIPQLDALDVTPDGDVLFSWGTQIWRYDGNFTGTTTPPVVNPNPQPPPPPTDTTKAKLSAVLAKAAYKVKRGKKLKLRVTASAAGSYKLDVLRKGKRVKRRSGKVKAGANTIAFKAKLKPGKYKLRLTLTAGGGTATDTATLKIRR